MGPDKRIEKMGGHDLYSPIRSGITFCWKEYGFLWPVFVMFGLAIAAVNPLGDFPLNDDWIYGKTVENYHRTGVLERHPYGMPLAMTQVIWGSILTGIFGFSYTVLRGSTLVLGLLGAFFTGMCARACNCSRKTSLLCALLLLFNPLYLNLCFTFMTDVPYLALSVMAVYWYLKGLNNWKAGDVFLGSMFALLACGIRQFGVFLPVIFLVSTVRMLVQKERRLDWLMAISFFLPWVVAGTGLVLWRTNPGGSFSIAGLSSTLSSMHDIRTRLLLTVGFIAVVLVYMGLFVLPMNLYRCFGASPLKRPNLLQLAVASLFCIVVIAGYVIVERSPMPTLDNVLYDTGTGPLTLQDTTYEHGEWKPLRFAGAWWFVTFLAVISGGILLGDFMKFGFDVLKNKCPAGPTPCQGTFLILWGASIVFSSWNPFLRSYLDRYILPLTIVALIICAAASGGLKGRFGTGVAGLTVLLLFVFSVGCAQDYLAWNRARWEAADFLLTERGISPNRIDGGFEFNGLLTSDEFRMTHASDDFSERGPLRWWVIDNEYAISFLPREGYREMRRFPYTSWFGLHQGEIKVLQRI